MTGDRHVKNEDRNAMLLYVDARNVENTYPR